MSALSAHPRTVARAATGTGATLALATVALAATGTAGHAADYTVQEGDTLTSIARRTGTDVRTLAAGNVLADPSRIRAGQVLRLPDAVPAAPAATPAPSGTSYTVRAGDTVSGIAAQHGTTVAAVVAANGLDSRAFVRAGQSLTIPGAGGGRPAAPAPTAGTGYTVRSGDTVSSVAARHGTTVAAVVAANGLDARATIRTGQSLTIPGAGTPQPPAPATTTPAPAAGTGYTVRSGDTVSAVAARHGTTVAAVVAANGLDARATIRTGQSLTIPGAGATQPSAPATQLVGDTFAGRTYSPQVVGAANQNKATLLATGAPSRADMQARIAATASAMGVDPALAQAVAYQESGFDHTSVSPANAIGAMQVIPSSGEWASQLVGRQLNLLDPNDNAEAGVAILRSLVKTSDDLPTAIASYYQGASSVKRNGMFSDTRRYVANVQTLMTRFR